MKKKQIPPIINGMGRVVKQIEALPGVIRTTLKNLKKNSQYREKLVNDFWFLFHF